VINLLDVAERTQKGPKMDVNDWNMGLFRKTTALVKEYQIAYPGDGTLLNTDPSLPQRAFAAAVDLISTYGQYCLTTGRVVQYSRDEVLEACREAPAEIIVGEGRDTRRIWQHQPAGKERLNQVPGHHAPFTEDLIPLVVPSFARIPSADYLEGINFTNVDGREIFGMPMEAYAARREAAWLRDGIRKAGRPGMAIAYYPINTRASVLIAPMDPDYGVRRTDGLLLSTLPGLQMEQDLLTAAIVYGDYGSFKVNGGASGRAGSFVGGYEGAIIEGIAQTTLGWLCYRDSICNSAANSIHFPTHKTFRLPLEQVWATSVIAQGIIANTNHILFSSSIGSNRSGPGTETHLEEIGLGGIIAAMDGANLYISRQARAQMNAAQTPVEPEWNMEVADAVIRMGLDTGKSSQVLRRLMAQLEGRPVQPPQRITDCYDLVHQQPLPTYAATYERVKEKFARAGLQFT
jgi:methylamine---corrinoid protein Co-methyltransferase